MPLLPPPLPWVGRLGQVALFAVLVATAVGYFRDMLEIGPGPILVALAMIAVAFGFGYLAGSGEDHLEDVGGLGTAQRNTAAGFIIATQNFDDTDVLVMITVANTLGLILLLALARKLRHDNVAPSAASSAPDGPIAPTPRPQTTDKRS